MRISILRENHTIPNDYFKIAEFYDAYTPTLLLKELIDEAYEAGNATFKVVIDFPENKVTENAEE